MHLSCDLNLSAIMSLWLGWEGVEMNGTTKIRMFMYKGSLFSLYMKSHSHLGFCSE